VFQPGYRGFLDFARRLDVKLAGFQRTIARAAFGPERELAVIVGRGNRKTSTCGLLALHHLVTVPDASISLGAASREQASIAFGVMRTHAEHPALASEVTVRHMALRTERGGLLRVVSGRGERAHGQTDSLMLGDEVWCWGDDSLLEAFQTSLVKRSDARLILISTAAGSLDSPLGHLRARALAGDANRQGAFIDATAPGIRWLEWSLEEGAEPTVDAVAKCNPSPTITRALLREQFERVTPIAWRQFHACQFGAGEAAWLPVGAWRACQDDYEVPDGAEVVLGVDIGGSRAASAVVAVEYRDRETLRVAAVAVHEGNESVMDAVESVREMCERFTVTEIAYDPWRFKSEAMRLEADGIGPMVEFPQSHSRMVPASERLASVIIERRLRHYGDPRLDAHIASAIAKPTGRGWRLDKVGRSDQIDAAVALCMAVERAQVEAPKVELLAWIGVTTPG
jgi:phage terminase large subunit-like protein